MAEPGKSSVSVTGLVKHYGGAPVVHGVAFAVREGHTLALLGPSGCGKTTILRCIAGLETPQAGRIELAGKVVFDSSRGIDLPPEQRDLGIVFQSYAVWPHMTVAENVGFPLRVRRIAAAEQRDRTRRILEIVGLGAMADRSAMALSGGQQQRVALARALVHEPRLVLFDEALSNLDAALRHHMRMELVQLQDRLGFTAIYVTHDQTEALGLAETIVLMNGGRLEASGPARTVFGQPATPFVARFFGMNTLPGRVLRLDGGEAEIDLGGTTIRGRVAQGQSLAIGAQALVCLHKEHVRLRRAGEGPAVPASRLPATVVAAAFLGLDEEYILDIGGGLRLRALQPAAGATVGAQVEIELRVEDCIVLDAPGGAATPASPPATTREREPAA